MSIIEVKGLEHTYLAGTPLSHHALKGIDIRIDEGECVAIIGHTGSGKSTLIQHFNGLSIPQTGTVVIDGVNLANAKVDRKAVRRKVGLVFQNPEDQIFEKIIGDDIAYGPIKQGLPMKEVAQRVKWAMEVVGLDFHGMKDRETYALSGGQKRKVALAGVLSLRPKVLVLDEPTAGLDPKSRKDLLARIKALNEEQGMTVVFVSHNMEEVAYLAKRVYVMADGNVVYTGTPRELFASIEELTQYEVGAPEGVEILRRLKDSGYRVELGPFQVPEVAAQITDILTGREVS
ncbi:energy-coupling factor transporter ATPase [Alicyclobacillus curvatus]|jgi:energy-coupling factor transport system ATP-binding protein|nr:energy-coupling factor transporter ATPase [Alicyclobacillus curvatus]